MISPTKYWQRIEHRISPEPISGCWLWMGRVNQFGYGTIGIKLTHRVVWEHEHGPIPNGLYVCHKCDVPLCVNPAHLFLGTQLDNMVDMRCKGRSPKHRKTHCPNGHPYNDVNSAYTPDDWRYCKVCKRLQRRQWYLRTKAA